MLRVTLLPIVVFFTLATHQAWAQGGKGRLNREAINLFRAIRAQHHTSSYVPQTCLMGTDWWNEAIPKDIANKYLGLKLRAALHPSSHGIKLQDVLDPDGKEASAFCTVEEKEEWKEKQLNRLGQGEIRNFIIEGTTQTFPAFDRNFRHAIVRMDSSAQGYQAPRQAHPAGITDSIQVYSKVHGVWRFVTQVDLWLT